MTVFRKCAAKSANQGGTAVNFRPWQNYSFLPGTFFISSSRNTHEYNLVMKNRSYRKFRKELTIKGR